MSKFTINGTVISVGETKTFDSGFTKRDLVVDTGMGNWPSPVPFTFKKDNVSKLDGVGEGDQVSVDFAIDGRKWDGPNGTRYFVDLTAFGVTVENSAHKAEATSGDAVAAWKDAHGGEMDKAAFKALCQGLFPGKASNAYTGADWTKVVESIKNPAAPTTPADEDEMPF